MGRESRASGVSSCGFFRGRDPGRQDHFLGKESQRVPKSPPLGGARGREAPSGERRGQGTFRGDTKSKTLCLELFFFSLSLKVILGGTSAVFVPYALHLAQIHHRFSGSKGIFEVI